MTNLLLVEDDVELAMMLADSLGKERFNVDVKNFGNDVLKINKLDRYDIIILDIMLPDISGIELLKVIREDYDVPVIFLTAKGDEIDKIIGLEMGADDYITKPFSARELVARLRALLRRKESKNNLTLINEKGKEYHFKELTLDTFKNMVYWNGEPIVLTYKEFHLLLLLVKSKERVVSKELLSEALSGRALEDYDRSVDVHISNLRKKLYSVANKSIMIDTIRTIGYRIR